MKFNSRVIRLLEYMTQWDVAPRSYHSAESHAACLAQYLYEYTEGYKIHIPKQCFHGGNPKKWFKDIIKELDLIRKSEGIEFKK